jgi:hypothetical protein
VATPDQLAKREERRQARLRLQKRLDDEDSPHAARLEKCGQPFNVVCNNCLAPRACFTRCDIKWCPSCAPALVARTVHRYESALKKMKWPLFVTLTTTNFRTGPDCIRAVRRAFGKLRRLRWFRRAVVGGIAAVEVTNRGKGWHPHVHALIDCRWLAVTVPAPAPGMTREQVSRRGKSACAEVAAQWMLCMDGRRSSVKTRRVWARDGGDIRPALAEVLKYSVTADTLLDIEEPLSPLLDVMSATRLVTSWGNCYRLGVTREKSVGCPCDTCKMMDGWMHESVLNAMMRTARK